MEKISLGIKAWKQFAKKVRANQTKLLSGISGMDSLIFVTGCQRSGTTVLANVLMQSPEVADYRAGMDSELEGALILCGQRSFHMGGKRGCFQTTYLNERYREYFEAQGRFRLLFVLRNPYSVVYSMVYNWKSRLAIRNFALNELFCSCGKNGLSESELIRFRIFGAIGFSALHKACLSYVHKTSQVFELQERLGDDIMIVEYDDVIIRKEAVFLEIFSFFGLEYSPEYSSLIHSRSINKSIKLSKRENSLIQDTCWTTYENARALKNVRSKVIHFI